jgi:hypothetical protein
MDSSSMWCEVSILAGGGLGESGCPNIAAGLGESTRRGSFACMHHLHPAERVSDTPRHVRFRILEQYDYPA